MKKLISIFSSLAVVLSSAMILAVVPAFAADHTVVVTQADLDNTSSVPATVAADGLNKWFMYNDSTDQVDNTLGSFVSDATSPNGVGSIEFTLGANPLDRMNIATYQFGGQALSEITEMSYTAYSHSGVAGANESPFFNFNVDFTGSNTWQKRLVYVPAANMVSVPQDQWNTFDVIDGGNALWTWSGYAANGNTWPDGNPSEYRKWSDLMTAFPSARVLPSDSWLGVRVGEPGPSAYKGDVGSFTLGTAHNSTTFNFEPAVPVPVTKADCKDMGWKTFNNPTFKNQGKCIDYVEHHDHKIVGNNLQYMAYGLLRYADFDADVADQNGSFTYKDGNKDSYSVKISKVMVQGNTGWFAGQVTKSKNNAYNGDWLFAKVEDGPDTIWGSFVADQTTADNDVMTMKSPADGPFTPTHGNIKVN